MASSAPSAAQRRVLFVDDDLSVLDGLRRMLRPMRSEWELSFATSGAEALAHLETAPCDVVVSDMRMPGMDGSQLLTEVSRRHPQVVRIVLSGQSDGESIVRSLGPTHQYLSKPCDADTLIDTVRRACALRELLGSPEMQRIVTRLGSLPSVPHLYSALVAELRSEEPSVRRVGEIIASDMAMSARVLQLVNSAFFGLSQRVVSPVQATTLLGLETMKALVLAVGVFSQFPSRVYGFSIDQLWFQGVRASASVRAIARAENAPQALREQALIAGLLHDVGRLVFAGGMPDAYATAIRSAERGHLRLEDTEVDAFGASHAEVGAYLLGLWGLPDPIVEAVAHHHHPAASLNLKFSELTVVHVASVLAAADGTDSDDGPALAPPAIDEEYLARIGCEDRLPVWRRTAIGAMEAVEAADRVPEAQP